MALPMRKISRISSVKTIFFFSSPISTAPSSSSCSPWPSPTLKIWPRTAAKRAPGRHGAVQELLGLVGGVAGLGQALCGHGAAVDGGPPAHALGHAGNHAGDPGDIASLPITIWGFVGTPAEGTVSRSIYDAIDTKSVMYMVVYFILIIGFAYFYSDGQRGDALGEDDGQDAGHAHLHGQVAALAAVHLPAHLALGVLHGNAALSVVDEHDEGDQGQAAHQEQNHAPVGYYFMMKRYGILAPGAEGIWPALVIIVSFIAGSSFSSGPPGAWRTARECGAQRR